MSGRSFLGLGCASLLLFAVYACDGDGDVTNASDIAADAGPDGAVRTDGASAQDRYVPPTELPPSSLALGEGFACIVAADHSVYCWGRNDFGQLGVEPSATPSCGSYPCTPTPVRVDGIDRQIKAITAGKDFACALDESNQGWCWGNNSKNQLQAGALPYRAKAAIISENTTQIVAAGQHACIRDPNGFLYCWGDNDCDLFGGSSDGGAVSAINLVTPATKQFSLGPDSMCIVTADQGEVYCWGADYKGSLGHPAATNGGTCNGGIPKDSSPKRWVTDNLGHTLTGAEDVHVGQGVTCLRKTDGTTLCAGDNSHGALGQGIPDSEVHFVGLEVPALKAEKLLVAGETACAVVADKLLCWGDARYGQMDTGGPSTNCGGTGCRPLGYVIPNQENLRDVAMSAGSIGTIKNDVSVWVWGRNDSGESGVARDDAAVTTCANAVKCVAQPRQMTTVPALK